MGERADGVLSDAHDCLGEVEVVRYGGGGVEDGAVDEDAHLVCAEVEDELVAEEGAGEVGIGVAAAFGVDEAHGFGDGAVPVEDLEVEEFDIFVINGGKG